MTRRVSQVHANAQTSALPSGGPTSNGGRPQAADKSVDKPTSSFDRRRHHIVRKEQEPSKIFVPLDPKDVPRNPNRGNRLHTDPFAMDRPQVEARRSRVKVATPRGPPQTDRRCSKPAPPPQPDKKPGFISANGLRHLSPKRVPKEKHMTTMERDQPPKNFTGSRRFAASPEKNGTVSPIRSNRIEGFQPPAALSPARTSTVGALEAAPTNVVPALDLPKERKTGLRMIAAHVGRPTMEGVWGPLPGGKAPKPSSLAPWMQESQPSHTGKRHGAIAARTGASPYAIEA